MKKLLYKDIKKVFSDAGCELLEEEYHSARTKMRYICECGNISEITLSNFKSGYRCKKCAGNEKLTYRYIKKFFEEQGCILLSKSYQNNRTKLKYICNCGNESEITFYNFKIGNRCKQCGGKKRLTFEYIQQYFKLNSCELLEKEYTNAHVKMKYICGCGNKSEINFNHFQQGRRCQKCGIEKRSGENNVNYNPDITDEERKIKRFYPEYKKWRTEIYVKDDYTCQRCSRRGGVLNAHHILNYSSNKELRTEISNGTTLCGCCHKKFHFIYGKKDNNKAQLDSFLKKDFIYE